MYSENLLREVEKEMQEIDAKKKIDLIKNIQLGEKKFLIEKNLEEITEEDKKRIQ